MMSKEISMSWEQTGVIKDKDELEDAIGFLFENLNYEKFEDSYLRVAMSNEPNEQWKVTKEEKVDNLRESIFSYINNMCG